MRRVSYLVFMVCVVGGCTFHSSCGGGKLDNAEVDSNVKASFTALGWEPTKVTCDADKVEPKVDATFTCQMELNGVKTYGVTATITDCKDSRCNFHLLFSEAGRVNGKKAEGFITDAVSKDHPGAKADCGEPAPQAADDGTVRCKVTADGAAPATAVLQLDEQREKIIGLKFE